MTSKNALRYQAQWWRPEGRTGRLVEGGVSRDAPEVRWISKQCAEPSEEITEIVSLLNDLGGILMGIDAKLQTVVMLLEDEDDDGD